MKILVFGASGMIGHKMYQQLQSLDHEVYGTLRDDKKNYSHASFFKSKRIISGVDAADILKINAALDSLKPDVILNCIGITLRKPEIRDVSYCVKINTDFPQLLKKWAVENNAFLIHFSTDCVFNGKSDFYTENSALDAVDTYGRTKAAGEVSGDKILTLRGSQIGSEIFGKSELFEWALQQKGKTIKGFTKAVYSGVTTNFMAELVCRILQDGKHFGGIYQVSSEPISKFELLTKLNLIFQLNLTILPDDSHSTSKILRSEKIKAKMSFHCPTWDDMLSKLFVDRQENSDLYGGN